VCSTTVRLQILAGFPPRGSKYIVTHYFNKIGQLNWVDSNQPLFYNYLKPHRSCGSLSPMSTSRQVALIPTPWFSIYPEYQRVGGLGEIQRHLPMCGILKKSGLSLRPELYFIQPRIAFFRVTGTNAELKERRSFPIISWSAWGSSQMLQSGGKSHWRRYRWTESIVLGTKTAGF
jgi:hypothetical protein